MKRKKFTTALTPEDLLDVTLVMEKQEAIKFSLNYRALIRGRWRGVYRVDNFHGFLHEQRFWRSPKPIRLEKWDLMPLMDLVDKYFDDITDNFQKYRSYYEDSLAK
jgi:hypothetical protein